MAVAHHDRGPWIRLVERSLGVVASLVRLVCRRSSDTPLSEEFDDRIDRLGKRGRAGEEVATVRIDR
jgi:two-component sensor histidine kinase